VAFRRIAKWVGIVIAGLGAAYLLTIAALVWFGNYMSEGVIHSKTHQGNVLVALSSDPSVRRALLSGCDSTQGYPAAVSALLSSGSLAEVPSGTKMHVPDTLSSGEIETMTISEGKLKGRQVWVCSGQWALDHAWP